MQGFRKKKHIFASCIAMLIVLAMVSTMIPALAGDTKGESTQDISMNEQTNDNDYNHNFTIDGLESTFYSFPGKKNLSTSKGTVTYNGMELTQCLKMETGTEITFTAPSNGTLIMVFNPTTGKTDIKVDGVKTKGNSETGILEIPVESGKNYTLSKYDSAYLFYLELKLTSQPDPNPTDPSTDPTQAPTDPTTDPTINPTQDPTNPTTDPTPNPPVSTNHNGMVTNLSTLKDADFKNALYVSPTAGASGDGTATSPIDLETAIAKCKAGQAILLMDGTYQFDKQITIPYGNNGSSNAYKVLRAADQANVIFDCSAQPYITSDLGLNARGLQIEGDYWYVSDITVYNAADNGIFIAGKHNVVEKCILKGNRDTGLQISRRSSQLSNMEDWPSDNLILNCTSFDNWDPKTSENADGFAAKLTCGNGNVFDGCISYCNSDDGWDLYAKTATGPIGVVTIRNCVSFGNGKLTNGNSYANGDMNGFKLGGSNGAVPTKHIVTNCLAFNNGNHGFTDNGNGAALTITGCTSYNNGKSNFAFDRTTDGQFINLLSLRDSGSTADKFVGTITNSIIFTSDKKLHDTGTTAVKISKGDKLGTIIDLSDIPLVSNIDSFTDLMKIDQICRNTDGTINMSRFLESADTSRKMGAFFGIKADQQATINISSTGTEEPSKEEPSKEQPSTEEPSKEEPSTEEPSKQEPSTEEPSKETPSTENPSTEEPTKVEPLETQPTNALETAQQSNEQTVEETSNVKTQDHNLACVYGVLVLLSSMMIVTITFYHKRKLKND